MPTKTKSRTRTRSKTSVSLFEKFLLGACVGGAALALAQMIVPAAGPSLQSSVASRIVTTPKFIPPVPASYTDLVIQSVSTTQNTDTSVSFTINWKNLGSLAPANPSTLGVALESKDAKYVLSKGDVTVDGSVITFPPEFGGKYAAVQIPAGVNSGVLTGKVRAGFVATHSDISDMRSFIDIQNVVPESNPLLTAAVVGANPAEANNDNYAPILAAPSILSPVPGQVLTDVSPRVLSVFWTDTKSRQYRVQVSCAATASSPSTCWPVVGISSPDAYVMTDSYKLFAPISLTGDDQMRVRVQAVSDTGVYGPWSDWVGFKFTTTSVTALPDLTLAINGAKGSSASVTPMFGCYGDVAASKLWYCMQLNLHIPNSGAVASPGFSEIKLHALTSTGAPYPLHASDIFLNNTALTAVEFGGDIVVNSPEGITIDSGKAYDFTLNLLGTSSTASSVRNPVRDIHSMVVSVDPNNDIKESNKTNNTSSVSVTAPSFSW